MNTKDQTSAAPLHDRVGSPPTGDYLIADPMQEHVAPQSLQRQAASGVIALCPETGRRLIKVLNARLDEADSWITRANRLARPLPLGTNPVANAMSDKFQNCADGDGPDSLLAIITAYREVLTQTTDAVTKAMRNFKESDDRQRAEFDKIKPEGHY